MIKKNGKGQLLHKGTGLGHNYNSSWTFLLVNLDFFFCCFFVVFLLPACPDRPSLEDRGKVQRVQRTVELGLRHILQRDNQESLMPKVSLGQETRNHGNAFLLPVAAGD